MAHEQMTGTGFLGALASRRRFGMRPGLDTMTRLCAALGNPERAFKSIHIAGTNGKGAVAAILDSCLRSAGLKCGRYTSPHLVRLNERFFLDGEPAPGSKLDAAAKEVSAAAAAEHLDDLTFFEALTAAAFVLYAGEGVDVAVVETGLGGRLDATNIVDSAVCAITKIGLDHCEWLGDTVGKIASEKAGIIKPGVPVVAGRNGEEALKVLKDAATALSSPFVYAPDIASEGEIPAGFPLEGTFNAENAVTALAVLKTYPGRIGAKAMDGFSQVRWPGRFQFCGNAIVDGAHNPPAAEALAGALRASGIAGKSLSLVAGFCSDKDISAVLERLSPFVKRAFAVRTSNDRSLDPGVLARLMRSQGIDAESCATVGEGLENAGYSPERGERPEVLVCGSLFLAGEALCAMGGLPPAGGGFRPDPSELLRAP